METLLPLYAAHAAGFRFNLMMYSMNLITDLTAISNVLAAKTSSSMNFNLLIAHHPSIYDLY